MPKRKLTESDILNVNDFKREDYNIYNNARKLDLYIDEFIAILIPKVHANVRHELQDESFNLVKNIYYAYLTSGNIRKKYVIEACVSVAMINHLLYKLVDLKVIKMNNLIKVSNYLSEVKSPLFGWRNKMINEE